MNDRSVASQSSLYFERYALAEARGETMQRAVYVLGAACVVLAIGLIMMALRPRPVHYVAASPTGGVSYPQRVPGAVVVDFASFWLMNWSNYAPETAKGVYERSMLLMAPPFLAKVRAGLDEELAKIGREKIAAAFTLDDEPRVSEAAHGFFVVFTGERAVYIGKEEMMREDVRFTVEVRRAAMTEKNPYGLMVWDVKKEKVSREAV
jgi:hypothetical protein